MLAIQNKCHELMRSQAAHCKLDEISRVLVGAVNKEKRSVGKAQWRAVVSEQLQHPRFDQNLIDLGYDVMLYKIEAVTKQHLQPIALNFDEDYPSDGQKLRVIGVGAEFSSQPFEDLPEELRYTDVFKENDDFCVTIWAILGLSVDPNLTFCLNYPGDNMKAQCNGDSGGPYFDLSTPPKQVGVVSFGYCGELRIPSGATKVSGKGIKNWLKKTICELTDFEADLGFCGGKCEKTGAKCSREKKNCCGSNLCAKGTGGDPSPRCVRCLKRGKVCGPGGPRCCKSLSCKKATTPSGKEKRKKDGSLWMTCR